jgi:ribulose-phosphate 3-epimerase
MNSIKIAPSILSADFANLGQQVTDALTAGAEHIHVDVMDGHFVPNITIGPLIVRALRPLADLHNAILDVHLMIEQPSRYVEAFSKAGADIITIHVEAETHLHRTIQLIHQLGKKAGVTLNPGTSIHALDEVLPLVDLVLVMSVNPGFGGQSYIPSSTEKIRKLRDKLDALGSSADLEVDGGINSQTVREVVNAGANVLVAGSAVFNHAASVGDNVQSLRRAALGA